MELYERDGELNALASSIEEAANNRGSVVFVCGEAGIGKTTLVRQFTDDVGDAARVLWGACDDLSTPRTLGPFRDIAAELGDDFKELLARGLPPSDLFDAAMEALDAGIKPTVIVIEDAHWGDGATFDMLKFLGRRIARRSVVLIVTYRDEEVRSDHPIRVLAGDLAANVVHRLTLAPLSIEAVESMSVGYAGTYDKLYAATGGNPFLVTEALAHPESSVTDSTRDSVVARLSRLPTAVRQLAEVAAVVPGQIERWLLDAVLDSSDEALAACQQRGIVEYDDRSVWYRHELVRASAEKSLSPARRIDLNAKIMLALIEHGGDVERIVHHAQMARDGRMLARFAPLAGRLASTAASHLEAIAHFRLALDHMSMLEPRDQARLLSDLAVECHFTGEAADGLSAAQRALDKWRGLGEIEREGEMLRWISRLHWWLGEADEAERTGDEAVATLEALGPSSELAMAYSNLAQLHMLSQRFDPAVRWATKAIEAARALDDHATLAHALNNLGSARVRVGDLAGTALLEESLTVSIRERLDDHAGRAFANIIWTALDYHDYDTAERYLKEGITYAEERELEGSLYYLTAERARLRLDRGDWRGAENDARWVLGRPEVAGITQMPALTSLAKLEVRRGDRSAADTVEAAWQLAYPTGELQRIAPVVAVKAELAWLKGQINDIDGVLGETFESARKAKQPWVTDELAFWMWRSGSDLADLECGDTPYAAQMCGRWEEAADTWLRLGCPYEAAIAQGDSTEPNSRLKALEIFDDLGAIPAATRVRRLLRASGVRSVPRGPRVSTRSHPGGLTNRQAEVLELLGEGMTNAEIAEVLFVSPKTVDHHVSAVLAKLGVSSRRDAVTATNDVNPG